MKVLLKDLTRNAIKKFYEDRAGYETFFLDNSKLEPGIYFKVKIENDKLVIGDKLEVTSKKDAIINNQVLEKFFKKLNNQSFISDSHKTIDVPFKKIYSTNVFSFCVRLGKLQEIDLEYFINNYFDKLYDQTKFIDMLKVFRNDNEKLKKNRKLFDLKQYIVSNERKKMFDFLKRVYQNSFDEIKTYIMANYPYEDYKTTYFKFYIEDYENETNMESDLYLYSNSYVKNTYNFLNDKDELVGIHTIDNTVNDKKPFMKNQTKFNKNISEAIPYYHLRIYKDVYNYIIYKSRGGKHFMNTDFNFDVDKNFSKGSDSSYQIYTAKGIDDIELIGFKRKFIPFVFTNYLDIKNSSIHYTYKTLFELKNLFFKVYIYENIDKTIPLKRIEEIKSRNISSLTKNIFYSNKDMLHSYFYTGDDIVIKKQIGKISLGLIDGLIKSNVKSDYFRSKINNGINMYINLLLYFNDKKGGEIVTQLKIIKDKLLKIDEEYKIDSLTEFCYVAGIVGYYLATQTEAKNKTYQLLENIYVATNINIIKTRLTILFDKYKHKINLNHMKFNILFNAILEYQTDEKITSNHKVYIYAGSLSNNILYQKNKGDEINE